MAPTKTAPCALNVDFALTHFLVSGELERSGQPVNRIITDAFGMSVLTAWAAGKLSSSTIKKTFDELLATKVPAIKVVDMGVSYKGYNPESKNFILYSDSYLDL